MTIYDEQGNPIQCEVCEADIAEYEWFDYDANRTLHICVGCRRTIDTHNVNEDSCDER